MTKEKALFVLEVLELASNAWKRLEAAQTPEADAANRIAARYSELRSEMPKRSVQDCAKTARMEFLLEI